MKKIFLILALGSILLGSCSETENKNTEGGKALNQIELAEKMEILGTYKTPFGSFVHIQKGNYKNPTTNDENEVIYVTRQNLSMKDSFPCDISEQSNKIVFTTKIQDVNHLINNLLYFENGKLYFKRYENEGFKECIKVK